MDRCQYNTFVSCHSKNFECNRCEVYEVYEKGRKDERIKIMNIVDNADDMAQAMYLLGQYIISEELKYDNRNKK